MFFTSPSSEQKGCVIDHLTSHSSHDRPGEYTLSRKLISKYLQITKANSAAFTTAAICKETLSIAGSDKFYTVSYYVALRGFSLTLKKGHYQRQVSTSDCLT